MNVVLETIAKRCSCRDYNGKMPEKEKLDALAKAALQAPSSMNMQPCKVVVINNKELVDEIDALGMKILQESENQSYYNMIKARGGKLLYNAPCMISVLLNDSSKQLDLGLAVQNVLIAATSLGLSSVVVGSINVVLDTPEGEAYKEILGYDTTWKSGAVILVGYSHEEGLPHQVDSSKISYWKK